MGATTARKITPVTPAPDPAHAARQKHLLDFLADPPPEILTAAEAVGRSRERYGDDLEGALADMEAGRHPLQHRRRARTPAR